MLPNKTFILTAFKGNHVEVLTEPMSVELIQSKRKALKVLPQWKGWKMQCRTPEGFKKVKILQKKIKVPVLK